MTSSAASGIIRQMKIPERNDFMRFFRRHKITTVILSVLILLIAGTAGYVWHLLDQIQFIERTGNDNLTVPTYAEEQQAEDGDIDDLKLSAEASSALRDADADIRANLDDSKKWYSNDVQNIMLFGYDYGSKSYPYGRSDAMIVLSINKRAKKVKIISLSRTAYAAIPGYSNTRLSHAHGYGGPDLAIRAIELNYKFKIDNFVACSFDSFKQIIDAFGGVPIALTEKEAKVMREHFGGFQSAGSYNLNGEQALLYARTRKIDTDRDRTGRQRKILISLAAKARGFSTTDYMRLLDRILPLVATDFTKSELLLQMASAVGYLGWNFEQHLIPAKPYKLVLRDNFEVILMNWPYEVDYLHEIMYEDVIPNYEDS